VARSTYTHAALDEKSPGEVEGEPGTGPVTADDARSWSRSCGRTGLSISPLIVTTGPQADAYVEAAVRIAEYRWVISRRSNGSHALRIT